LKRLLLGMLGGVLLALLIVLLSIPVSRFEHPGDLLAVKRSGRWLLDDVHLVDVNTGATLPDQQLLIANGRIAQIRAAGTPAAGSEHVIDGHGAWVTPGLFDLHVHIHDRKYLGLYLAHGVTTVRNMRGFAAHLRWKQELQAGEWLGSNLVTSSPVLDGEKYAHALQQVVTDPEHARALVRRYQQDGYDLIKAYGYLDAPVFEAVVSEARQLGFPVAKHGPNPVEGLALESNRGMQSLEHVEDILQGPLQFNFEAEALDAWLAELKQIDPVVVPTLATYEHLTQLSEHKQAFIDGLAMDTLNPLYRALLGEFAVKRWLQADAGQAEWNRKVLDYLMHIVQRLDEEGVTLALGSDGGTMYIHATVLRTATINAARTLGIADDYGSIEAGKVADLVLVGGNPLEDLGVLEQPQAVIKAGQWLSEEDLQALKTSGANPSSFYVTLGRLLEDVLGRKF
jgi:imidazolonepropionase-like amidohydrolase